MNPIKNMDNDPAIRLAKQRIRNVIAQSRVPEDAGHAENTRTWVLRIDPDADVALRLAALAHDIERARPKPLKRQDFEDYDVFKAEHAALGATITDTLLAELNVNAAIRQSVRHMIAQHEHGGDQRSDLLKDADSLSYFDHNLPFYYQREGWAETLRRARWGYQRLSPRARSLYHHIRHPASELQRLMQEASTA